MAITAPLNRTIEMFCGVFVDICISSSAGMLTAGHACHLRPLLRRRMCEIALRRHERESRSNDGMRSRLGCLLDQLAKPAGIGQHECTSVALHETRSLQRLELARYRFTPDADARRDLRVHRWRRYHGSPWPSRFGPR